MGGKTSTSTSQVSIPPEVLARYNSVNATAQQVAQTPFQQYSTDPNAFVAPLDPTQQAGVANTNAAAGMAQPYFNTATGFALAGANPVNASPLDVSSYMNPYLSTVLGSTEALVNQQNQQAMAGQTANAINQGYFGGDRSGIAAAVLQGQQELAGGQLYSGIASDAYTQALAAAQQQQGVQLGAAQANRQALQEAGQTIAGLGTGAQQAALTGAQAQLGAGQVQQQTEQAGLTALYNQFLQQQSYPFQTAQFLANIAEGTGALSGSTTTTTQPQSIFSDERLKEDMEPIGKGFDGANIYRFRYKGDPTTRIGMSAQEIERKHPEAVSDQGGFKAVDYGRATDDAAGFARAANDDWDENEEPRQARQGGGYSVTGGMAAPAGVNPYDIAMLLQAQQGMYAPYNQSGLYGGQASGAPHGGGSYVPPANLPVAHLSVASPPMQRQESPLQDASELASTEQNISRAVPDIRKGWDTVTGHKAPPADDPAEDAVATEVGNNMSGTPMDITAMVPSARGGFRLARQDGGDISSPQNDDPYATQGPGLHIPTTETQHQQLPVAKPPGQGQSGFSQALGAGSELANIGMATAKFLPMIMALQSGGRVGKQGGGGLYGDDPPDPSAPPPAADDPGGIAAAGRFLYDLPGNVAASIAGRGHDLVTGVKQARASTPDPTTASDIAAGLAGGDGLPTAAMAGMPAARPLTPRPPPSQAPAPTPAGPPPKPGAVDRMTQAPVTSLKNWGVPTPAGPGHATPPANDTQQAAVQRAHVAGHGHGVQAAQSPGTPAVTPGPTPAQVSQWSPAMAQAQEMHGPQYVTPQILALGASGREQPTVPLSAGDATAAAASGMPSSMPNVPAFGAPTSAAAAASGMPAPATANVPGFGNADATKAAVAGWGGPTTMPDIAGFSRAGNPAAAAASGMPTPASTDVAGFGRAGVSAPTPAIAGAPAGASPTAQTPSRIATTSQQAVPPGVPPVAAQAAAQHPGGFGGLLGSIGHVLSSFGGGLLSAAGYQGNGQWNMDRLIPILNAIGVAGSVPTVHPFVALAAGLRGYGQGYMQQQQAEANLASTNAQTAQTLQATLPPALAQTSVWKPGPATAPGQRTTMVGRQPWHLEFMGDQFPEPAPEGGGGGGGGGGQGGASAPAATAAGQPAAATAPAAGGAQAAAAPAAAAPAAWTPGTGKQAISRDDASGTYNIGPTAGTVASMKTLYPGIRTDLNPRVRAQYNAAQIRMADPNFDHDNAVASAEADRQGDPVLADNLQANQVDLATAVASLPEQGLLASGPGADARTNALNWARQALRIVGVNNPLPDVENAKSAQQVIEKLNGFLSQMTPAQYGIHASAEADIIRKVLPSAEMNKGAAMNVLAHMMVQTQKTRDFANYRQSYKAVMGTDIGVVNAYRRDTSGIYGPEETALARALTRSGNNPSIAETLIQHPETRRGIEDGTANHKGLGVPIGRYFIGTG